MNKLKLGLLSLLLCLLFDTANATSYGDLYNVEWCPCNPEERYDAQGSVVLGKTVMCPCDSMYDGYKSTMEKDLRKIQHKTKQTLQKARNFKYYVGFDYNKSQASASGSDVNFDDIRFSDVSGLDIPSDSIIDDQDNIGIVIGTRPHSNLGIEAFYNRSYSKNVVTQIDNRTINNSDYHMVNTFISKYQAFGVDLLGYMPVTDYFDFIAFVGLGQYMFDNEAKFEVHYLEGLNSAVDKASFDFGEDALGWRIGGGMQVNIARGLVLRAMYRYIKIQTDTIDSLQEFSVGIRFLF
ncbi:MAG: porin family protein [Alphaproteobacteria bacterium]|nr:porin family protein [Alphaproteobacteria bacterium]